jgi:hypothetical protein
MTFFPSNFGPKIYPNFKKTEQQTELDKVRAEVLKKGQQDANGALNNGIKDSFRPGLQ